MRRRVVTLILAILTASTAAAAESSLLFENSDFEKGDLTNWTAEGSAFESQPSKGDKLKAQGEFLIATDEKPTGKLTSAELKVTGDYLNFRIGGGAHANTSVRLLCEGREYYLSSGFEAEQLTLVSVDVRNLKKKTARVLVTDGADGGWGYINVDDFTFSEWEAPAGACRRLPVEASRIDLPKIFWHEPTKKWVMALFVSGDRGTKCIVRFFNSDDLKNWVKTSDVGFKHFHECPNMLELPVDGDENNKKWIIYDAGLHYYIGTFDGKKLTIEESPPPGENGRNVKAGQTFNNMPDGRAVQVVWMVGAHIPRGGWHQALTFPVRLTLHTTDEGIRLYRWPIKEIELLYTDTHKIGRTALKPGANLLADINGELLDIYAEIEMGSAERVVFNLRGSTVTYDGTTLKSLPARQKRKPSPRRGKITMKPQDGKVNVRILVDRASIETFGNDGRVSLTDFAVHEPENLDLSLTAEGGEAVAHKIVVHELESAWE